MRKGKGYQQDINRTWYGRNKLISSAKGSNLTLEQFLKYIDDCFERRVKACKKEYERIATKTTLNDEELRKYRRDWMLWEVRFTNDGKLIPFEEAMEMLRSDWERVKSSRVYDYAKRITNKDNQKFVYNSGTGQDGFFYSSIRIPSMKRSNQVWKRFYELFPMYKENFDKWNNKNGVKLKKVW